MVEGQGKVVEVEVVIYQGCSGLSSELEKINNTQM